MPHSGTELINPFKVLERAGICAGWHVADLGCGALGHFVFPAAQFVGNDGKVYAVDIQKVALHAIERKAKHEGIFTIQPVWSDIEVVNAARIPSESIDLIIVANNFYLCQNRAGLVQEVTRLTKPGGRILVIEWKKDQVLLGPPEHRRIQPEEVKTYFIDPPMMLIDEFSAGEYHYALLYQKGTAHEPSGEPAEQAPFIHVPTWEA
ncbi:MAG: methyltransferase domain-containing protein [Patescibacteria group bacterium]